jgi:hypothetical protein
MSNLILPPGYKEARLTGHQRPVANPEMEERVRKELRDIDSLLDIKWIENIVYNARHGGMEGRYALVCTWPSSDPRWGMIQTGEIGNTPYDILGWFAEDMQNAESLPQEPSAIDHRVQELLASADNTRVPWRLRLKAAADANIALKIKRRKDFEEGQAHDIASYERNRALGIHQASVLEEIK